MQQLQYILFASEDILLNITLTRNGRRLLTELFIFGCQIIKYRRQMPVSGVCLAMRLSVYASISQSYGLRATKLGAAPRFSLIRYFERHSGF